MPVSNPFKAAYLSCLASKRHVLGQPVYNGFNVHATTAKSSIFVTLVPLDYGPSIIALAIYRNVSYEDWEHCSGTLCGTRLSTGISEAHSNSVYRDLT